MILNIAHRGARSLAPENTLLAAQMALNLGADMWETDLVISSDEALILFHDDTLTRTTNAKVIYPDRSPWNIVDFSLSELKNLDCGSWFLQADPFGQIRAGRVSTEAQASYQGARIPTLEEGLLFTRDARWKLNIELKKLPSKLNGFPIVEHVLALVDKLNFDCNQLVISSFNHRWLKEIQQLRPDIDVQALIGSSTLKPLEWGEFDFKTYNARHTLMNHQFIGKLAEKGIAVNLWSVNEEEDMRRYIDAGAAGIFTDFPQRLSRLLGRPMVD
jgi:glycerophosphoryl diester phosphodiesterase